MVIVNEIGDSDLEEGSMIDKTDFNDVNKELK